MEKNLALPFSAELTKFISVTEVKEALDACHVPKIASRSISKLEIQNCKFIRDMVVSKFKSFSRYNWKYVDGGSESSYIGIQGSSLKITRSKTEEWLKNSKKFLVLNDITRGNPRKDVLTHVSNFLNELLPDKTRFEL